MGLSLLLQLGLLETDKPIKEEIKEQKFIKPPLNE